MRALFAPVFENLREQDSGPYLIAIEMIDLAIARVRNHDPLLGIEHAQALGHVVERGVEAHVHGLQLDSLLGQQLLTALLFGDVLVGGDPAAAWQRLALNEYLAAI